MQAEQSISRPDILQQFGGGKINYKPTETVDRRATRWFFYAGDVIPTRRKQEFKHFRHGGDELELETNKLFRKFMPRCVFVPLQLAPRFDPPEYVRENAETLQVATPDLEPDPWKGRPMSGAYMTKRLVGVAQYPADDAATVVTLNSDQGLSRGIKEIKTLQGMDWDDEVSPALQSFFFPNFAVENWDPTKSRVPTEIREVEDLIRAAITRYENGERLEAKPDLNLAEIGHACLQACDEYRVWGENRIAVEHALISLGTTPDGYTHGYSELADVLLPQLEIERQDQHLRNQKRTTDANSEALGIIAQYMAGQVNQQTAQQGVVPSQAEIDAMIAKAVADGVAKAVANIQAAEKPKSTPAERLAAAREAKKLKAEKENTDSDPV